MQVVQRPEITASDYLTMLGGGIIGMVAYTFYRIGRIKKKNPTFKRKEVFAAYLDEDWNVLLYSFFLILALMFGWGELMKWNSIVETDGGSDSVGEVRQKYWIFTYTKWTFMIFGAIGHIAIDAWLGTTSAKIPTMIANNPKID